MAESNIIDRIKNRLRKIYDQIPYSDHQIEKLFYEINKVKSTLDPGKCSWDEKTILLITYGDSILKMGQKPLVTLNAFVKKYLTNHITHIHILPFFPYSSDDGFSVIDYKLVDPKFGKWNDIRNIGREYKLMFDLIINHVSRHSKWFRNYCQGIEPGKEYFIEVNPEADLSQIIRPRTSPLLTAVDTRSGVKHIWTTFSEDQVDLNFKNPDVLLRIIYVLLFYLLKGARYIRLDAIAFLWKELGTSCLHLLQTHEIVKLLRDIVNFIDPTIVLITETNVPEKENRSYFGTGDEASMVYQFSLPPLLLHALITSNSFYLNKWVALQPDIPESCTYLNFTASHDGIGVRPLEGLLPEKEIDQLIAVIKRNGGYVSTKRNNDGTESPYELNITYLDALKNTANEYDEFQVSRFICSQTLMMSFRGIPAFYIHSLLGTHNDHKEVSLTGLYRSINRHKWNVEDLNEKLRNTTDHSFILSELLRRISLRQKEPSFHPDSQQTVINNSDPEIFMMIRGFRNDLIVLANLSAKSKQIETNSLIPIDAGVYDLLGDLHIKDRNILLKSYQVCWLKKKADNRSHQPE